uniref:Uncharacterized protein n=1 Tax=Glossina palpalis gambiensis TaxID=67801 RepID=A0A1B0C0U1_9MUSC
MLAFHVFLDEKVDVVILEGGIGGMVVLISFRIPRRLFCTKYQTNCAANIPDIKHIDTQTKQLERVKMQASNWDNLCMEDKTPNVARVFPSLTTCFQYLRGKFRKSEQLDVLATKSLDLVCVTILALNDLHQNL